MLIPASQSEDLTSNIVAQMRYYFSDHFYGKAHFLHRIALDYVGHFIPVYTFLSFQRIASALRPLPQKQQRPAHRRICLL